MEERDEKPPGPLKASAQVSGASLPLGDPELVPTHAPQPDPLGLGPSPALFAVFWGLLAPPNQQASNTYTLYVLWGSLHFLTLLTQITLSGRNLASCIQSP